MPDTPENQKVYPPPPNQKPGPGFPLARIAVLLSLATGACHDLAIAASQGTGIGESNVAVHWAMKPGWNPSPDGSNSNPRCVPESVQESVFLTIKQTKTPDSW